MSTSILSTIAVGICDKSGAADAPFPIGTTLLPFKSTSVLEAPIPLNEYATPPEPPLLVFKVGEEPCVALICLKTSPRSVRPEALMSSEVTTVTGAEVAVSGLAILDPVTTTTSTSDASSSCAKAIFVRNILDITANDSKYLFFIIILVNINFRHTYSPYIMPIRNNCGLFLCFVNELLKLIYVYK